MKPTLAVPGTSAVFALPPPPATLVDPATRDGLQLWHVTIKAVTETPYGYRVRVSEAKNSPPTFESAPVYWHQWNADHQEFLTYLSQHAEQDLDASGDSRCLLEWDESLETQFKAYGDGFIALYGHEPHSIITANGRLISGEEASHVQRSNRDVG